MPSSGNRKTALLLATSLVTSASFAAGPVGRSAGIEQTFIVQGANVQAAQQAVTHAGGGLKRSLPIINAVSAELTGNEAETLRKMGLQVFENAGVQTNGKRKKKGGARSRNEPTLDAYQSSTPLTEPVSVIEIDTVSPSQLTEAVSAPSTSDKIDLNSEIESFFDSFNTEQVPNAAFPQLVQAADAHRRGVTGAGVTVAVLDSGFADVDGLSLNSKGERRVKAGWDATNNSAWTGYWDDPINQAVMRLWQAGVVVVASSGNGGPDAMTIGVPGNTPCIITVGAMSDDYSPADPNDDVMASFSAAVPTYEGFVKPEVVAPGGHINGIMSSVFAGLANIDSEGNYYVMGVDGSCG